MTKAEIWKASDTTTRRAIRGSVREWVKVVEGRAHDRGIDNCPLCGVYWSSVGCDGCPVQSFTRKEYCEETPISGWAVHTCENCSILDSYSTLLICSEALEMAKAELRFLAGFVPAREKLHAKVKTALATKLKDTRRRARALGNRPDE